MTTRDELLEEKLSKYTFTEGAPSFRKEKTEKDYEKMNKTYTQFITKYSDQAELSTDFSTLKDQLRMQIFEAYFIFLSETVPGRSLVIKVVNMLCVSLFFFNGF